MERGLQFSAAVYVGGLVQRKGNCCLRVVVVVYGIHFTVKKKKKLKSQIKAIFNISFLSLECISATPSPFQESIRQTSMKDSEIGFDLVNLNVVVYRFSVP